jgi:hypothetical protein
MPEQQIASDRPALNESAIKAHALRCSQTYRAGKFTRVGQDFIDEVYTDVECIVREIRNKFQTLHPALAQDDNDIAICKGPFMDKLGRELDKSIARLIQNKVQRQPTTGCTLGRTR